MDRWVQTHVAAGQHYTSKMPALGRRLWRKWRVVVILDKYQPRLGRFFTRLR